MKAQKTRILLIKFPYWLGIGADALWVVVLFFPAIYGSLIGNPDFQMTQIIRQTAKAPKDQASEGVFR